MGTALVFFIIRVKEALMPLKMPNGILLLFLFKSFFSFNFTTPFISFSSNPLKNQETDKRADISWLWQTSLSFLTSSRNFNLIHLAWLF